MNRSNLANKIKDVFIVAEDDGSYNLFGTYIIKPESGIYKVVVMNNPDMSELSFSSLKYAVTWCVLEKNKKVKEIKRVQELDSYIESLNVNIAQYKKLIFKKTDDRYIYMAKLFEDKIKKLEALKEIDWYTAISKHIQNKKYQEYQDKNPHDTDKYNY